MYPANQITVAELRTRDMIDAAARYRLIAEAKRSRSTTGTAFLALALALALVCAVAVAGVAHLGLPGVHAVLTGSINGGGVRR